MIPSAGRGIGFVNAGRTAEARENWDKATPQGDDQKLTGDGNKPNRGHARVDEIGMTDSCCAILSETTDPGRDRERSLFLR
jgi:hypothetical protein